MESSEPKLSLLSTIELMIELSPDSAEPRKVRLQAADIDELITQLRISARPSAPKSRAWLQMWSPPARPRSTPCGLCTNRREPTIDCSSFAIRVWDGCCSNCRHPRQIG